MQAERLEEIQQAANLEELKKLCAHHLNPEVAPGERLVFGEGSPRAKIMIIGEAPGAQEARTGRPFVGNAGKLLDKLLMEVGLERNQVYICNILKTHPPGNRRPLQGEIKKELPFLKRQMELIQPRLLLLLGATALQALVDPKAKITQLRGSWLDIDGIPALVTYHPAAALRDVSRLEILREDFAAFRERL